MLHSKFYTSRRSAYDALGMLEAYSSRTAAVPSVSVGASFYEQAHRGMLSLSILVTGGFQYLQYQKV